MGKNRRSILSYIYAYVPVLIMLLLTSCMKTDIGEKVTSRIGSDSTGETNVMQTAEEMIADIDIAATHCNLRLNDKFLIDADITPYDAYKDGFGLYYFYYTDEDKLDEDKDLKKLVDNIDAYFGKDVTVTYEEYIEDEKINGKTDLIPNVIVDSRYSNHIEFVNTGLYPDLGMDARQAALDHMASDAFRFLHPSYSKTCDAGIVEKGIDAVFRMLDGVLDCEKFKHVQIMYFDEDYYKAVEELYLSAGRDPNTGTVDVKNREKYYFIRLTPELDNNIMVEDIRYLTADKILGNGKYMDFHFVSSIDLALTEEGEIIGFMVYDGHILEREPFDHADIVDVREVIKSIYSRYSRTHLFYEITVKDVYLTYAIGADVNGDDVKFCVQPYWVINYLGNTTSGKLDTYNNIYICDAITGKFIAGDLSP